MQIALVREKHCERIAALRMTLTTSKSKTVEKLGIVRHIWNENEMNPALLRVADVSNRGAFRKYCRDYGVDMANVEYSSLFDRHWTDLFTWFTLFYTERYKNLSQVPTDWLLYVTGFSTADAIMEEKLCEVSSGKPFMDDFSRIIVRKYKSIMDDHDLRAKHISKRYTDPKTGHIYTGMLKEYKGYLGSNARDTQKQLDQMHQNILKLLQSDQRVLPQLPSGVKLPSWFE